MSFCKHTHIYIYIYRERERETNRRSQRVTDEGVLLRRNMTCVTSAVGLPTPHKDSVCYLAHGPKGPWAHGFSVGSMGPMCLMGHMGHMPHGPMGPVGPMGPMGPWAP